jgi:hypothetical protein
MEIPSGPRQTGWQGAHIPQLKYRNPVPSEDAIEPVSSNSSVETAHRRTGPAIRDIRLSMGPQEPQQGQTPSPPRSLMPPSVENLSKTPSRKKPSLFGNLFTVKEPTQVALNQVTAQIMAQHGSTSAKKVPNVSMEKMPEHVPKVNAKWDGVPDAVKQRDRREKERVRTANRESLASSNGKPRSSGQSGRPSETRGSERSNGSRGDGTRSSRKHDSYAPNPHRFYAQSVNSSGDLAAQQREEDESRPSSACSHQPSVQTSSSKSLADAGLFPDDISPRPKVPAQHKRHSTFSKHNTAAVGVPEHERSPEATPREASPITPPQQGTEFGSDVRILPVRASSTPDVPTVPKAKMPLNPNHAFLAGEAQEFQLPDDDDESIQSYSAVPQQRLADVEKRPDSSRDRLGLRANIVVKGDRPWDPKSAAAYERPASANDHTNAQLKPKNTISKAWGSLLKREV